MRSKPRLLGWFGMKTIAAWLSAIIILVFGAGLVLVIREFRALGSLSFTKSVEVTTPGQDRGYYYRFKASLAYKGEPLDFDIVVGCNVRITTYKDNDRTVEIGLIPTIYGLKMKDGHGIVVRPPQACNGETTENGKVPKTLLPLIATFESADQPWSGVAYASDDAYDSPLSELKFFGATISKATREEWQEWRQNEAPKNFVTYALLGINAKNHWDAPYWKPGYRVMATDCLAGSRVKIPDSLRDMINGFWPADRPTYWYPGGDAGRELWRTAYHPKKPPLFEGNRFKDYLDNGWRNGLSRRAPGAVIFFRNSVSGEVYPARTDHSINKLGDDPDLPTEMTAKRKPSWSDIEIKPELRGFAFCEGTAVTIWRTPFQNIRYANRVNGEEINEQQAIWGTNFFYAFERDEYVIFARQYGLADSFAAL
ncbi:hypothetical protein FBZ93_105519 [Bradyrhizobium macuxiense]|uniref:Uncharacterized protein n=2 Tax=Bradyrhizobium macuxiense TaxID=1755647 RepID=A0A560LZ81_9BRAD|nr:hypothetical protein FBZ93_105519 [Bradyrhizobium macuxiense]